MGKEAPSDNDQMNGDFEGCIETGFQLATFQGPLCAEPMEGLAFFVESLEIDRAGVQVEQGSLLLTLSASAMADKYVCREWSDVPGDGFLPVGGTGCMP